MGSWIGANDLDEKVRRPGKREPGGPRSLTAERPTTSLTQRCVSSVGLEKRGAAMRADDSQRNEK